MRIRIVDDVEKAMIAKTFGKTWAEKRIHFENDLKSSHVLNYLHGMKKLQGTWQEVETEFLFEDQYNIKQYRVLHHLVDALDISPEFNTLEDYIAAIQKRYEKDWPGTKVNPYFPTYFYQNYLIKYKNEQESIS